MKECAKTNPILRKCQICHQRHGEFEFVMKAHYMQCVQSVNEGYAPSIEAASRIESDTCTSVDHTYYSLVRFAVGDGK